MKTGAHELKGLVGFHQTGMRDLHLPLIAIIDYKGYRVVAVSLLPISDDTLMYGSRDAGKTVYCNPTVSPLMKAAGKKLNIKGKF